jgi:hypothetical protein
MQRKETKSEACIRPAGRQRGADRAAVMTTLISTAKLNHIDPLAWLADIFAGIADLPKSD